MSKAKSKAEARKQAKARIPTLAELEERERDCRFYMECRRADAVDLPDLPAIDADEEEADCAVGEIEDAIQEAINLRCDGEEWLKAFKALREAKATAKQAA